MQNKKEIHVQQATLEKCPRLCIEDPPTAFWTDTLTLTFNTTGAMVTQLARECIRSTENRENTMWLLLVQWDLPAISAPPQSLSSDPSWAQNLHTHRISDWSRTARLKRLISILFIIIIKVQRGFDSRTCYPQVHSPVSNQDAVNNSDTNKKTKSIWKMLGPFATASRRTPPVLHCHLPGVATVARRHCCTLPAHRCPQQHRQRVTEGTAMAPWNGSNNW